MTDQTNEVVAAEAAPAPAKAPRATKRAAPKAPEDTTDLGPLEDFGGYQFHVRR